LATRRVTSRPSLSINSALSIALRAKPLKLSLVIISAQFLASIGTKDSAFSCLGGVSGWGGFGKEVGADLVKQQEQLQREWEVLF